MNAVSSLVRVWGKAPAANDFGAFRGPKTLLMTSKMCIFMHMICPFMPIFVTTELTELLYISCRKKIQFWRRPLLSPGGTSPLHHICCYWFAVCWVGWVDCVKRTLWVGSWKQTHRSRCTRSQSPVVVITFRQAFSHLRSRRTSLSNVPSYTAW